MANRRMGTREMRAAVQGLIRLLALGMLVVGAVGLGNRVVFAVRGRGDMRAAWTAWQGIGAAHGVFLGVPLLVVGMALAIWSAPITRWAVRPPAEGCVGCGYAVSADAAACPECGRGSS